MAKYAENMRSMISETIRQNIHQAAIELIRESGWKAFTTEKIAERLGVSRGVLYNYYKNKEDIAHSIIERSFEELNAKLRDIAVNGDSAAERLRSMAELNVGDFIGQRELHRTFMENLPPPGARRPSPVPFHFKRDEIFAGVIEEGIRSGEFQAVDSAAAVTLLTGGLHELCIRSMFSGKDPEIEPLLELFLKGMKK